METVLIICIIAAVIVVGVTFGLLFALSIWIAKVIHKFLKSRRKKIFPVENEEEKLKLEKIQLREKELLRCYSLKGGAHNSEKNLTVRDPFKKPSITSKPKTQKLGRYYFDQFGRRVQLLNLEFIFRHKDIKIKNDSKRRFYDIFYGLRSGRYTSYSHCRYCFEEQKEFFERYNSTFCCKCGLPTMKYITFENHERFCVVCALMNKYHPRPHIRCKLHRSTKGKDLGAMYVLYKEAYSISSASKAKKKCKKSDKLSILLQENIWKLNSALRYEYIWLVGRRLIGKNLVDNVFDESTMDALAQTKKDLLNRRKEIGEDMKTRYKEHGLIISLKGNQFSQEEKQSFFDNLKLMIDEAIVAIDIHINYLMKERKEQLQKEQMQNLLLEKKKTTIRNNEGRQFLCGHKRRLGGDLPIEYGRQTKKIKLSRNNNQQLQFTTPNFQLAIDPVNTNSMGGVFEYSEPKSDPTINFNFEFGRYEEEPNTRFSYDAYGDYFISSGNTFSSKVPCHYSNESMLYQNETKDEQIAFSTQSQKSEEDAETGSIKSLKDEFSDEEQGKSDFNFDNSLILTDFLNMDSTSQIIPTKENSFENNEHIFQIPENNELVFPW